MLCFENWGEVKRLVNFRIPLKEFGEFEDVGWILVGEKGLVCRLVE